MGIFKTVIKKIQLLYDVNKYRKEWRSMNIHNETFAAYKYDISKVTVGKSTYGTINVLKTTDSEEMLIIGNYCSIAPNVQFILGSEHPYKRLSTFPFGVKIAGHHSDSVSKGNIIVCDDVWIGYGAIILSGITISQGAIVAAGSVVTRNVPPYSIVGGNPAKVLKYRFEQNIIDKLLTINFTNLSEDKIRNNYDQLEREIDSDNCDEIVAIFGEQTI
jgi:acetyltransferase-like isoleucine patch superfamily enzyme